MTSTESPDTVQPEQVSDTPPFRYTPALAEELELRWQDRWEADGTFETPNPTGVLGDPALAAARGRKLFVLDMFPYPSGTGLHVGHPLGYIGTDVYARFKRMTGHNVLYSMGFDAFGLPAEQYAVQTGQHPAVTTDENIANMRRQLRRMGLSHDPRRSIQTTDPGYYRWTQWIFEQVYHAWFDPERNKARPIATLVEQFESGARPTPDGRPWAELSRVEQAAVVDGFRLAYVSDAPVNWVPGLGTVVANEEVTADGRSDRGNFPVFKRNMRQWMMRITAYAERLLDDLDTLDWSDAIKTMQRNWIGRSTGAYVHFQVVEPVEATGDGAEITVFTTRPDTLFGATFMVLAPEHPLVDALTTPEHADAVAAYRRQAQQKKDVDRQDEGRDKTGEFTGAYAVNPLTGEPVPVWIADYVLMGYGTGAIMGVPCGDQRDFEFARKFGLAIPAIQEPPADWFEARGIAPQSGEGLDTATWPEAYVGDAPYVNSATPDGELDLHAYATKAEGVAATCAWLEASGGGRATVTYKLRDWLFSRQRYWGEPFPIVWDDEGLAHTLPESMLPVVLPETDSFSPRTFDADDADSDPETPLDRLTDWVDVTLDLGDGPRRYRRETNTMPQWAGSCWYQLRYLDPANDAAFVDPEVERYWVGPQPDLRPDHPGGVDLYVGGVEHAVLHLLYARFWHKVLYDLGHLSSKEPYTRLFNQGYVQAYAYTDARGVHVEAKDVVERDGHWYLPSPDGDATGEIEVRREYGKMGKSLKNSVSPDEMYEAYGADTLRLYEMATGPLDASRPWETRDVVGMYRFLQRLWRNVLDEHTAAPAVTDTPLGDIDPELVRLLHRTIDTVRTEMDALRFNTAIAKLIELNNALTRHANTSGSTPRAIVEPLVLMLAPLAPHAAEELWHKLGRTDTVTYAPFPVADPAYLVDDTIEYPVQVNGKVRGRVTVPATADRATIEQEALSIVGIAEPTRVVFVPGKMINIVQ